MAQPVNASLLLRYIVLGAMGWLVYGCQREPIAPPQLPASVVKAQTIPRPGLQKQVTAYRISGLDSSAVSINQETKEITVRAPARPQSRTFIATVKTNCTDCLIIDAKDDSLVQGNFCSERSWSVRLVDKGFGVPANLVVYTVKVVPTGPLKIIDLTEPLRYEIAVNYRFMTFSAENYYDGSPGRLLIRQKGSNQTDTAYVEGCLYDGSPATRHSFTFYSTKPGEYELTLLKKNGRRVDFPVPILVSKGSPVVTGAMTHIDLNREYGLYGSNLFAGDELELVLKQNNGNSVRVRPTRFSDTGEWLYFKLPATIKPGYYFGQIARGSQEFAPWPYGAIVLVQRPQDPYVQTNSIQLPYSSIPLRAERGEKKEMAISASSIPSLDVKVQFVCQAIKDPQNTAIADVTIPDGYWQGRTEGTGAYFTFPTTMNPGTYQLTPRFVLKDGTFINGLLFPVNWLVE